MKTPEEIKVGLACEVSCNNCPYHIKGSRAIGDCGSRAAKDAIDYIEKLEETIALMKIQMMGDCGVCRYKNNPRVCACCMSKAERPCWEYEGLPEVKRHDKPV